MKNILEKVPLPTFLFMALIMAISMYPLYAKDNTGGKTETPDYERRSLVQEKEGPHAWEETESEKPAIVNTQITDILWEINMNLTYEKENETTITANASDQVEENEEELWNNEIKDQEKDTQEPVTAKSEPQANEKSAADKIDSNNIELLSNNIEPVSKYIEPVSNHIEPVSQVNANASLNKYVLDVIATYAIDKVRYPYLLNNDYANYNGVTQTLTYQGQTLLRAHPSGSRASHCVGITFEVLFRALQQRNVDLGIPADNINSMSYDDLFDFVMNWFAASGPKRNSNIAIAVEKYGIGKRLYDLDDVKPGDFIDLNRKNGTGHTVVFINWIREGNRIIGLRYWSSQPSTGGINYNEEYFGNVLIDQMYMVKILTVDQYK